MKEDCVPSIQLSLKIDSRLDVVPVAGQLMAVLCTSTGMESSDSSLVEVCVVEAMNNCVEHAYRLDPTREVELKAAVFTDRLVLEVCDSGISADPAVLDAARDKISESESANLEDIQEHGWGLAIIQKVMDSCEYKPGAAQNRLLMTKRKLPA